jgi:hypothetical protein
MFRTEIVAGSDEHDTESSESIICGEISVKARDYYIP